MVIVCRGFGKRSVDAAVVPWPIMHWALNISALKLKWTAVLQRRGVG